jgi:probable phosphoglycerate mutase
MEQMLFLLRHGETMWNRNRRMQGHLDSPLTRNGVEQAQRMGRTLARHLDGHTNYRVIASPLGRCRQTAALVCEEIGFDYHACEFEDALMEISSGDWDGMTMDEIDVQYPGELAERRNRHWEYVPPNGESYAMLSARVAAWLDAAQSEDPLVVVAHGGVSRVMRGHYAKLPPHEAVVLEQPQDAFYLLTQGQVARVDVED